MGLFDKIKKMFKREEEQSEIEIEKEVEKVSPKEDAEENNKKISPETVEKVEEEKRVKEDVKIYEKGLSKSRENFVSKLINLTNKYHKVTEEYFEELEEILIMADIGVNTVMDFMDRLRSRVKHENIEDTEYLKELIVDELFIIYVNDEVIVNKINFSDKKPTVILFVGVNGVGKTTTIAKLADKMISEGKKVKMIAGDTFRAGATKQLEEWATKVGASFTGREEGVDPSSVIYDGLEEAVKDGTDVVMIDTAGRLQNKTNLMNELEKINRVIGKIIEGGPHETLLVIDATTGQNGISQAKAFKEITDVTGIVLTKLDGTAKGGIVLAIRNKLEFLLSILDLVREKKIYKFLILKNIFMDCLRI